MDIKKHFDNFYSDPLWFDNSDHADHRLGRVMEFIERYSKHLDVGCANGLFTKFYLDKYPDTEGYGIDISDVAISMAKENCPQGHFVSGSVFNMPYENNSFDMVHSTEVVELLENPQGAVDECYRVLKKGGIFITTIPFENPLREEHIWKWDIYEQRVHEKSRMNRDTLHQFKIIKEIPKFYNDRMLYIICQK